MRTLPCLLAAAALALAPRLALAEEPLAPAAPPAPAADPAPAPPPEAATIIIVIPAADPAAPPVAYAGPLAPVTYMPPAPPALEWRRRNPKLMVGGLIMIPIGLALLVGGGVMAANNTARPSLCHTDGNDLGTVFCGIGDSIDRGMTTAAAYSVVFMGGATTLAGSIMAGVGGSMVLRPPRWVPQPAVGAKSGSLTWAF